MLEVSVDDKVGNLFYFSEIKERIVIGIPRSFDTILLNQIFQNHLYWLYMFGIVALYISTVLSKTFCEPSPKTIQGTPSL